MEELSRRTGIHVGTLWRAFNAEGAKINGSRAKLEAYYNKQFPDFHFSEFVAVHDEQLQDAFQLAVLEPETLRDPTDLRHLFKRESAWVFDWDFKGDRAAAFFLRARFLLASGWTNVLLDPQMNQFATLKAVKKEADACAQELAQQPERPHLLHLIMKLTKLKISAEQRLHLLEHKKHLPVTNTIPRPELENFLQYLLSQTAGWPKGHFNRWQWARDAVTISSGLSSEHSLLECSKAYAILLDERPEFNDIDHPEWTVGPAANDPDLKFFRKNIDKIRKIIKDNDKESNMLKFRKTAMGIMAIALLAAAVAGTLTYKATAEKASEVAIVWPSKVAT